MKTDFSKIKSVEAAAIFVALFGLSVVGFEIAMFLPAGSIHNASRSLAILDVSDSLPRDAEVINKSINSVIVAFEVFNQAFTDSVAIPDELAALRVETLKLAKDGKDTARQVFDMIPVAYAAGETSAMTVETKIDSDYMFTFPQYQGFSASLPKQFISLLTINH